jgi:aryl-alcohol dehydrogenase-like predicted oxidoreductase
MQWLYGLDRIHRLGKSGARQHLLALAAESGASGFDVAPMYGNGIAECELGRFLGDSGLRSKLIVNTKFGIPYVAYGFLPPSIFKPCWFVDQVSRRVLFRKPKRNYSAKTLVESVETSLRRLKTDYIDTLFIHEPLGTIEAVDELKSAFEQLNHSGKVRWFGVSGESLCIHAIADSLDLQLVQAPLKLLQLRAGAHRSSVYHLRQGLASGAECSSPALSAYYTAAQAVGADTVLYQTTDAAHLKQFIGG